MADARLICPSCSETKELRKSHFRFVDNLYLLFRLHPYRCMMCHRRFHSSVPPAAPGAGTRPPEPGNP